MSMYILILICGSNIRENMQVPGILLLRQVHYRGPFALGKLETLAKRIRSRPTKSITISNRVLTQLRIGYGKCLKKNCGYWDKQLDWIDRAVEEPLSINLLTSASTDNFK